MAPQQLNATIVRREEVGPGLIILGVKPDTELFTFEPGQYATLGLPGNAPRHADAKADRAAEALAGDKLVKRAYSIASPSSQRDSVEFYLNMVDDGAFTPRLFHLGVGGRVWLSARAVGTFTLEGVAPTDDVILIATGTGLAPFVSMLLSRFNDTAHWTLIHGTRYVADLGYRELLSAKAVAHANLHYLASVTRPEIAWSGHTGRVQTFFDEGALERATGHPLDLTKSHVYMCGNPDMITQMQGFFESRGLTVHKRHAPGRLHIESYW